MAKLEVMKRDLMVASTRQHRARLLKYNPRPPCAPSFVKSRTLRPLQTHFLLFQQQIFFVLVCIHPGNPWEPPRVLAFGPKPEAKTLQGAINYQQKGFLLHSDSVRTTEDMKPAVPDTSKFFLLQSTRHRLSS